VALVRSRAGVIYCSMIYQKYGRFLLVALLGWAGLGVAAEKPNLVFILTDDQAPDTLAAWQLWGNDVGKIQTPHLDRLVKRGTSFKRAYNMGGWQPAVCVSSRTMLITGQSLWRASQADATKLTELVKAQRLLPQRIKAAGYNTYFSGKWHVRTPVTALFDRAEHVREGMPKTGNALYNRPLKDKADAWQPWDESLGGFWEGGTHWSEVLAADAEQFIAAAAQQERPFFLYLAFNAPHDPRQSPQRFVDRYPAESIAVPENFQALNPHYSVMGLGPADTQKGLRDERLAPFPRTERAVQVHRQEYYALVTHLDEQIGKIFAALDRHHLQEKTIIVFTSDHGLALGRHGLMGKQNVYEHSLRVPFVMAGPGIPEGKSVDTPIYLQDVMPTLVELAGGSVEGIEFRSVLPALGNAPESARKAIYAAYLEKSQRAIIVDQDKLILYPEGKVALHFDLRADPLELQPLPASEATLPQRQKLFAALLEEQKAFADPLDLRPLYPELARAQ
jgi:arylsulfatase A-like enzyme